MILGSGLSVVAMGCGGETEGIKPLWVHAAASTHLVVEQVAEDSSKDRPRISAAASSMLVTQIRAGAPADLVVLADEQWMDELDAEGLILGGSRVLLARNRLVVVVPADSLKVPKTMPPLGRIAVAEPRSVPLGRYTDEVMDHLGWKSEVDGRLLVAGDARAVLALVERGDADAGIVYASDALGSGRVRVVHRIPGEAHRPIRYEGAILSDHPQAQDFLDRLLKSDVFVQAGFMAPEGVGP